jgi:hypothetical protein
VVPYQTVPGGARGGSAVGTAGGGSKAVWPGAVTGQESGTPSRCSSIGGAKVPSTGVVEGTIAVLSGGAPSRIPATATMTTKSQPRAINQLLVSRFSFPKAIVRPLSELADVGEGGASVCGSHLPASPVAGIRTGGHKTEPLSDRMSHSYHPNAKRIHHFREFPQ